MHHICWGKVTKYAAKGNLSYLRQFARSTIYGKPKIFQINISKSARINRKKLEKHKRIFNVENPQYEEQKTMGPSLEKFHHKKYK